MDYLSKPKIEKEEGEIADTEEEYEKFSNEVTSLLKKHKCVVNKKKI